MTALWSAEAHEPLSDRAWDPGLAAAAVDEILADAEQAAASDDGVLMWPGHPLDGPTEEDEQLTVYLGSGGMIWALAKLGDRIDAPGAIAAVLARYRARFALSAEPHPPSLLVGETGLLVVAEAVGSPTADSRRLSALARENRDHPAQELLYGSAGTAIAARACGLRDAWEDSARALWASRDEDSGLWTQSMGGQPRQYLGAGHGFVSNIVAVRGLVEDEALRSEVARVLGAAVIAENGNANWPPFSGWEGRAAPVQWCHGAPGILATVAELMPPELAAAAGEATWRAGPLRKGPTLCHGTAGNGFAFLRLHALTGNGIWLERARRFAMHAAEQVGRARAEYGRGRYSLWTGDVGVALYLRACLEVDARFPIIDMR